MGTTKKYWKGIEELQQTPEFLKNKDQEFPQQMNVEEFLADENLKESSTPRRDFLKFLGFSVAAATVAACEAPVTKAIPYVNKPENVTPGMPTWYASTFYDGNSYANILVKTREGRPIYIKGNKDFGISGGATNPQIIASVLGLYEGSRLKNPMIKGNESKWSEVDTQIKSAMSAAGSNVTLVSSTIISPSIMSAISEFATAAGKTFKHIQYDAISYAGMRMANQASFGKAVIPSYDFSKAKTIVSIGCDFLNGWLFSTSNQAQYAKTRKPDGDWMSKHFQFESMMSITGSNADYRGAIKPSEQANVLAYLISKMGGSVSGVENKLSKENQVIADKAAKELSANKGAALVVAGSNNKAIQILTNKLNSMIGAYGSTIDLSNELNMFQSQDTDMITFVNSVIGGSYNGTVMFLNSNPVYTLPNGQKFGEALNKMNATVSFASHSDETASRCKFICPDHHALEAWMDMQPTTKSYSIAQPTIRPLFNTASCIETFLVWAGKAQRGGKESRVAYEYMQGNWKQYGFAMQNKYADFETYWNMAVHNGTDDTEMMPMAQQRMAPNMDRTSPMPPVDAATPMPAQMSTMATASNNFNDASLSSLSGQLPKGGKTEIILYQKAGLGNGGHANNPWLQELPDPMTKVTWDNYITMNPKEMTEKGYKITYDQESGLSLATIKANGVSYTLPVYPLPGQALGTVGLALGYGRGGNGEMIGTAAYQTKEYGGHVMNDNGHPKPIGENAFRLLTVQNGTMSYDTMGTVEDAGGTYLIAATQIHHTVMARHSIVRETTLDIYKKEDREAYNPKYKLGKLDEHGNHVEADLEEFDLWDAHPVKHVGHRWGMSIDLSSCFGCGACMVACQAENNVPVVGKDEVRRGREMHWIRIDRYFSSDVEATIGTRTEDFGFDEAEHASLNPKVIHMPMMCHHCNHAPCETVCPVAATTHSNEGLNQMTYNRCIGTRYCANNCPYKVRRFNWFNYPSYKKFTEVNPAQDDLGRMVLNPDVTVRTRGVMEKCSFCVQRIQAGKLEAKVEARPVMDGDISPACADACPNDAIIFGDWNDEKSMIRSSSEEKRAYQALEEVGVQPNLWYKVKVRNEDNDLLANIQHEEAVKSQKREAHGEGKENKKHH